MRIDRDGLMELCTSTIDRRILKHNRRSIVLDLGIVSFRGRVITLTVS
jgi:hypothetical protein